MIRRPQRALGDSGFTLLESLIALTLLGIGLLLGVALLLAVPRILKRLDAERQAYRAVEGTLEALRAGVIPLQSGHFENFDLAAGSAAPPSLTLDMTVTPVPAAVDLFKVRLVAHSTVAGKAVDHPVETLVFATGSQGR